jgi:AraC family transcriptional activator of mtrCDE
MTNSDAGRVADDALSGLASLLRVRPELEEFCRFGGAWASSRKTELAGRAYFHIMTKGSVQLDRAGCGPLRLGRGRYPAAAAWGRP